ncbi:MAG: hypothetical protein KC417_14675, partial [Myxococcales bacterium]|nr:hypothetical protein [Myxococcales bacterium]
FMILSATLAYMSSSSDGALRRAAESEAKKEAAKAALLEKPTEANTQPAEDTEPTSLELGTDSDEGALDVGDNSDGTEETDAPTPTQGAGIDEEATVAPTEGAEPTGGAAPTEPAQDLPAAPATP